MYVYYTVTETPVWPANPPNIYCLQTCTFQSGKHICLLDDFQILLNLYYIASVIYIIRVTRGRDKM